MIFSLAQLTTDTTATTGVPWSILTGSTPGRAKLLEIGFFVGTVGVTAQTLGVGRPNAVGNTATSPVDFLPEDPADVIATGILQACLAWTTTKPTAPTNYFRRVGLPLTIGSGVIWTFPKGLVIPVSGNIVIYNATGNTGPILNCYAVADL
jgi:hypothetical protein